MQKLKKYAKNWSYKLCITFSIVSILCISVFPLSASADDYTYQTGSLSDFFQFTSYNEPTDNYIVFYDDEIDNVYETYHLRSGSGDGVFYGNVSRGNFRYSIKGNFLNKFNFDPSKYYTLSFPLSFSTRLINIGDAYCSFSLVDKNGGKSSLKKVNALWPDKLNGDNNYMLTIFFEGTFSGAYLVEVLSYELTVGGNNYNSSSSYFIGGLLKNRYVTITEISKLDYESVYGNPDIEYDVPSSAPQDELSSIEGDLINKDQLDSVGDFISQNGGNSISNVANGLHAASILFSELFNFNGRKYTIFVDIVQFSLTLGLIGVLLNLAPTVFGHETAIRRRNAREKGSKNKGGKDN